MGQFTGKVEPGAGGNGERPGAITSAAQIERPGEDLHGAAVAKQGLAERGRAAAGRYAEHTGVFEGAADPDGQTLHHRVAVGLEDGPRQVSEHAAAGDLD